MSRRIHGDEAFQRVAGPFLRQRIVNNDAAELCGGRKDIVTRFDVQYVCVAGHRPIRAIRAVGAVMHRVFAP